MLVVTVSLDDGGADVKVDALTRCAGYVVKCVGDRLSKGEAR